jgi:hypothetical protein
MKKFLFVVAIAGIMTSCKDKKDEKKAEEPTTIAPTEPTTTEPTNTAPVTSDVKFSDPEVQKFADEYTAFVKSYKTGMVDPAKAQELSKTAQEWTTKMQPMVMILATNPVELKKWQDWAMALSKEMMPAMK